MNHEHIFIPKLDYFLEILYRSLGPFIVLEGLIPQLAAIALISLIALYLKIRLVQFNLTQLMAKKIGRSLNDTSKINEIFFPFFVTLGTFFVGVFFQKIGMQFFYLKVFSEIAVLLLALKIIGVFLSEGHVYKILKGIIIVIAVLQIVGILNEIIIIADNIGVQWRGKKISIFFLFKITCILVFLFTFVSIASSLIERSLTKISKMNPSVKAILVKLSKVTFYTLAFFISLEVIGIDLTALTVFSGAVGISVGFGLQKIFSNFICGIILLSDRSIKPGDVIGIENTYGWVNSLGARYVSIITRDGKEHLIPNESLITNKVENWSFSDSNVRVRIPLRIDYQTDVHRALDLIVNVATNIPRVLKHPEPKCLVRGFGEYAIELELRIWIGDPASGMGSIQSEILIGILDIFKKSGIKIPNPILNITKR